MALETSTHDLKNIENLIEKMIKLSETYKGEELREKLDILHKVYSFLKKDQTEGSQNFFETFNRKYTLMAGDRTSYNKREEWEEAHQRERCINDVDRFSREMDDLLRNHRDYLTELIAKQEFSSGEFGAPHPSDEMLESEEPSDQS